MPSDDRLDGWLDDQALELNDLIEQITVDAYGDEAYWSFCQAFDDHVRFPVAASIVGTAVAVAGVDFDGDERRGLAATVRHSGRTWTVSLLDLVVDDSEPRFKRLVDAYRRWLGVDR